MNRFLRAGENGGLLTDCRELSPNHTAASSSSSSSSSSSTAASSSSSSSSSSSTAASFSITSSSSSSAAGSADRHAALPSLQTRGPGGGGSGGSEPRRSALKRSRAGRERREEPEAAADHSAAAVALRGGGGEVCVGVGKQQRREAQGRSVGGEGLEMISAVSREADGGGSGNTNNNNGVSEVTTASPSATCAKGKEERKGKNVIRGWKRERDRERDVAAAPAAPPAPPVRTRKEKPGDGSSPPPSVFLPSSALAEHHLCRDGPGHCHCPSPDARITGDNSNTNNVNNNNNSGSNGGGGAANKTALDCGVKSGGGGAIVVRRQHDDTPAAKKHRGVEKVDPMFTVPAPPAPGHPGAPGSSLPLAPSFSPPALPTSNPKQTAVRTRSIGTNTQDGGVPGGLEGDSACLGPCQPGTSVNLEGIVWHETEEGVLVVNVTWRKRTYVGTLLDCTKHDWAPPRFCESPSSDPELPGGRGRGKRMRMALAERPCIEPAPATKVRGLSQHRSRGGGVAGTTAPIHSKGRRGSLNLINNCRTPPSFFTVEEVKSSNSASTLSSGKRKNKPPADLDLSLVSSDDIKNGNGKRIRAKSRSAPSTPQGKSDPSFMDPGGGCASSPPPPPILIDCPHPNCTKRYKHINGLRYHQTHAHLEAEEQRKPELEPMKDGESEERLSDCEDTISNMTYDLSETNNNTNANSSSKKPAPLYKVTTVGSPKNRRLLLSTDQSPTTNSKTRRTSLLKDGLIDDLSNLPIISNMTVVLENCMVPDRNSTVEMPKLEAEGLIDKKGGACDKGKKANGKVEKLSKSRTNRPIAPAPAPPKLIAIPNATYPTGTADTATSQQPSPMAAVGLTSKNLPLKPIKPKLSIVVEPSLVKPTLVSCSKETRKKEKRRLKDKHNKDLPTRTPNGDSSGIKMEDGGSGSKMGVKEISGSLLKEHLSKQDVMNGLTESQESRMASIRAEADKVYTFTDNAPSPSIGSSSRLDASGSCLATADGSSKNNSPAYSDISDAGDDGGSSECRSDGLRSKSGSSASSEVSSNSNHGSSGKTPPTASAPPSKDPQSPYYHSYEPYYLQGYIQSDRQNSSSVAFHKSSAHDGKGKDRKEEMKEDDKGSSHEFADSKKGDGPPQSQLQLAMSQTQTALAQSLYYGQYSRGLYMDQKLLLASKCCDQTPSSKQRGERGQGVRDSEDVKHMVGGSASGPMLGKGPEGTKSCCPKPVLSYVEMSERGERGQSLGLKAVHGGMVDQHQVSMKDCDDIKSPSSSSSSSLHNPNSQTDLDSNVSFSSPSDGPAWAHRLAHSKYSELQSQHGEEAEEGEADRGKEWGTTMEPAGAKMISGGGGGGGERGAGVGGDTKKSRVHGSHDLPPAIDTEDSDRLEGLDDQGQEPIGGLSEESQSARAAVSPPMTPQQPYIQYQHSSYPPYLAMCESGGGSYRGVSPTLVHNYPGFHYPLYGKTAGREESDVTPPGRGGVVTSKQSSDSSSSSAMELLQQQSHQYHGKSPAPGEKGSPEGERETDRERNHVSFARHLHTHHHTHLGMSYNLMSGQYDIYQGLSSRSLVSSQQVSGHSSAEGEGKK